MLTNLFSLSYSKDKLVRFRTPTLVGVFVCLVANSSRKLISPILFNVSNDIINTENDHATTHRAMTDNKAMIKTIPHNFVLLQNVVAVGVANAY